MENEFLSRCQGNPVNLKRLKDVYDPTKLKQVVIFNRTLDSMPEENPQKIACYLITLNQV